ncbi:MAG: pyridoxal phosphate-dependent aminotransferase [Desulfatirhabdiaceae bacterium]
MFSSRIDWCVEPNRLMAILEQKKQNHIPILDLTDTNPTTAGLVYDSDAIQQWVSQTDILLYHPDSKGSMAARESIAEYYRDHGQPVNPDQVFLTASTSEAYAFVLKLLCDPGDEILVPQPSYPLFDFLAAWESVSLKPYPLVYSSRSGWQIDMDRLLDAVSHRCRAIVVVNPNNPTGSFFKPADLKHIDNLCRRFDLALIVDEVFLDYPSKKHNVTVNTAAGHIRSLTFTLSGLSKICGVPQLKLGWIHVSGSDSLVQAATTRLELIADTYLSVSTPVQVAAPHLLMNRQKIQDQIQIRIEANEKYLQNTIVNHQRFVPYRREGGWYQVLSIPDGGSDEELACHLLEQDDLLVHPGYFYDLDENFPCLVLSLITPPHTFQAGICRLMKKGKGSGSEGQRHRVTKKNGN